jgi:DNA repair exonuclease SbcCD ATPase subunit
MDLISLRKKYEQAVGQRDLLREQLTEAEAAVEMSESHLEDCLKARTIIQTVAEQTQKKIEYHISNLVSMALAAVFPDPYTFVLRFVKRREKTEADLLFVKDGNEGSPMDLSGGGPLDVASFALRTATWAIKPTRNVLIQDEPFKYVSRDLQSKCSEMLKYLSNKLNIQMILVSHVPEIIDCADAVFEVTHTEEGSSVRTKVQ